MSEREGHLVGPGKPVEADAAAVERILSELELSEAIPPAYTEHIGHYLMAEINARAAA